MMLGVLSVCFHDSQLLPPRRALPEQTELWPSLWWLVDAAVAAIFNENDFKVIITF